MPETEVETILREIRAQVHADQEHTRLQNAAVTDHSLGASNGERLLNAEEPIRIDVQLSTIARAWDRLPPVVSNRRGWVARLELWFKGLANNAMRWFTWEQVNFNAAVHHALRDTQEAFSILEQRLSTLRSELQQEGGELREDFESEKQRSRAELEIQGSEIRTQGHSLEQQTAELLRQRTALEEVVGELRTALKNQASELGQRLAELAQEVREGNERLVTEQRVCLKQLSFEAGETALMMDRTRRDIEARLDKLVNDKDINREA